MKSQSQCRRHELPEAPGLLLALLPTPDRGALLAYPESLCCARCVNRLIQDRLN